VGRPSRRVVHHRCDAVGPIAAHRNTVARRCAGARHHPFAAECRRRVDSVRHRDRIRTRGCCHPNAHREDRPAYAAVLRRPRRAARRPNGRRASDPSRPSRTRSATRRPSANPTRSASPSSSAIRCRHGVCGPNRLRWVGLLESCRETHPLGDDRRASRGALAPNAAAPLRGRRARRSSQLPCHPGAVNEKWPPSTGWPFHERSPAVSYSPTGSPLQYHRR
jgi:hypothetical protein